MQNARRGCRRSHRRSCCCGQLVSKPARWYRCFHPETRSTTYTNRGIGRTGREAVSERNHARYIWKRHMLRQPGKRLPRRPDQRSGFPRDRGRISNQASWYPLRIFVRIFTRSEDHPVRQLSRGFESCLYAACGDAGALSRSACRFHRNHGDCSRFNRIGCGCRRYKYSRFPRHAGLLFHAASIRLVCDEICSGRRETGLVHLPAGRRTHGNRSRSRRKYCDPRLGS